MFKQKILRSLPLLFFAGLISVSICVYPETIVLKDNRKIKADILIQTDDYIILETEGVKVKYYRDEIKEINSRLSPEKKHIPVGLKQKTDRHYTGRNFLWQVESKKNKAYILGSIHLGKKDWYPLSEPIESAFNRSEVLAVEIDIGVSPKPLTEYNMISSVIYPEGVTLKDRLSEDTYGLLRQRTAEFSIPVELLEKYKPWVLALTLESLQLMRLGYSAKYGIDYYFLQKAKTLMPVEEIESMSSQTEILNSLSPQAQESFLLQTLKDLPLLEEKMEAVFTAWREGHTEALARLLKKDQDQNQNLKQVYDKLFKERNWSMSEKIISYLESERVYFVVVGAGHLVGQDSILTYLKDKGYSINQK
jgi:uncharacterized protein